MSAIKADLEKHNFRHPSFGKTEVYIRIISVVLMHMCNTVCMSGSRRPYCCMHVIE